MNFKQKCFLALHTPYTKPAKIINGLLSFIIIVSIGLIPLTLFNIFEITQGHEETILMLEKITVTIFAIEYILRIYSAPKPFQYITSWWGIIDLVAILPFVLSQFIGLSHPEIFSMLRVLRILKLAKINELNHAQIIKVCRDKGHGHFAPLADEKIQKVVQKHPLIFFTAIIVPLILSSVGLTIFILFKDSKIGISIAILFFAFAMLFYAKAWLDYLYDVIFITDQRIVIQNRKLFGIISNDIAYTSITNIIPDNRGLFQWLLGFGDIQLQTAAGITPSFIGAPKPHNVVNRIIKNRQTVLAELKEIPQNTNDKISQ